MRAPLFIAMDDTDAPGIGGTGRLARQIAASLTDVGRVIGVTRHQLLRDPRVPYTKNNSANAIHLVAPGPVVIGELAERVSAQVCAGSVPGSDPALCILQPGGAVDAEFGRRAQTQVLDQAAAAGAARDLGIWCRSLGGSGDGIIGALAAVLLAAEGNDGWFVQIGGVRDLTASVDVGEMIRAGVDEVLTGEGQPVRAGMVDTTGRVRPLLRNHRARVVVEPAGPDVAWRVIDPRRSGIAV